MFVEVDGDEVREPVADALTRLRAAQEGCVRVYDPGQRRDPQDTTNDASKFGKSFQIPIFLVTRN